MRLRSWIVTTLVIGIVQLLLSLLLVLQHNALYSELLRQRISVIAQTTAETFRPVLGLGLPISMLRDGNAIVARSMAIDPNMLAVHAIDPSGTVVYSTGPTPATVPAQVLTSMRLAEGDVWGHETQDLIYSGVTIRRGGGGVAGAVIVEYPPEPLARASRAIVRTTLRNALLILLGTSAIAFVLIYGAFHRPRRRLAQLAERLDKSSRDAKEDATTASRGGAIDAEFARMGRSLHAAEAAYRAADRAIRARAPAETQSRPGPAEIDPEQGGTLKSSIVARVVAITVVLIVASALLLGTLVTRAVTKSIEPELAARTDLIGTVISGNVQRALESGIMLDEIVGGDRFFGQMLERLPEVAYIAIATGRIVIEAGERIDPYLAPARERRGVRSHPIYHDGQEVAYVIIDIDPRLITKRFRGVFLDIAVILLVTLLLAYEALVLLTSRTLSGGLEQVRRLSAMQAAGDFSRSVVTTGKGRIQTILRTLSDRAEMLHRALAEALSAAAPADRPRLERLGRRFGLTPGGPTPLAMSSFVDVRLALFLFSAADELPLAFLPLYTRAADNLWPWLQPSVLIALPLAGYLLAITVMSPWARVLVERIGVRGLFLAAAVPTLVAHVGLYAAGTAQEIILWRTVTGFGYALVTLAAQDYVIGIAPRAERDEMLGHFTLVHFAGVFSGVALGGVLADRLGPANVFLVSAILIAASVVLSRWLISPDVGRDTNRTTSGPRGSIRAAVSDIRLAALIFGISIPTAVVLQAFVSYLVAIMLDAQGANSAEIGRILMLYFIAVIAFSPVAGGLPARMQVPRAALVLAGAVLTGLSLMAVTASPSQVVMALAMIGTGTGCALVRGTQVALALGLAEEDPALGGPTIVLGTLRASERVGSIFGLIAIAALSGIAGFATATLVLAAWALLGAAAYAALGSGRNLTQDQHAR